MKNKILQKRKVAFTLAKKDVIIFLNVCYDKGGFFISHEDREK